MATKIDYGRLRIMNLDHVHHNSIERNRKEDRYLRYRTLDMSSGCGSLIFALRKPRSFRRTFWMIASNDISNISDNHDSLSTW